MKRLFSDPNAQHLYSFSWLITISCEFEAYVLQQKKSIVLMNDRYDFKTFSTIRLIISLNMRLC